MNDFNPDKVLKDQFNPVKEIQLDLQKKYPLPDSKKPSLVLPDDGSSKFLGGVVQQDKVEKPSLTREVPISEGYDMVGGDWMAKYPTYKFGADNAEYAAQTQTPWNKISNGLVKFQAKTLNAVVGGTAGVVYGLGSAISNGNLSSLYDNDFSNWLSDLDSKLNYQLPNYYTKQEKELGLGGQMMTFNFWADKFLGGLSFTTGAIVSEGIWAWATGGTSLASTGARWGSKLARLRWGVEATEDTAKVLQGMSKWKGLLKEIPGKAIDLTDSARMVKYGNLGGKAGEVANLIRFTATSAGYEASVEALQFRKEAEEKFFNRKTPPTPQETAEFYKNLESASNGVFWTNMAIVGSSNLVTMGNIFGLKSPIKTGVSDFIERKAFGLGVDSATKEVIKQTGKQKAAKISYEYLLKPALTEGLYEEGFQGVTTKVANKWMEHTYDPKKSLESFDMMASIADSMGEQYGTKEGWVENGLGMIIGIVGGSINAKSGMNAQKKELEYKSSIEKKFDQASLQAQILPERLKMMNQINGFNQEAQVEAKKGNIVKSQLAQNDSILSYINAKNSLGDSVSDITKEINSAMESITPEQWKDAGVENIEDYKKETLSEFERIAKSYEKNKTFWSYIVGKKLVGEDNLDQGVLAKEAFGNLSPNQMMVESLTWASVRGENASKYMNDIQEVLTSELGAQKGKVTHVLNKLSGATGGLKTQLNKNLALHDSLLKERDVLEKAILKLQNAPKETEGQATQKVQYSTLVNKLVSVNEKIQNIQNALEDIAEKVEQTRNTQTSFEGIDLKGDLTGQKITAEDLISLKENVKKLQETLSFLSESDPQRGEYLQDLMKEYQDANDILLAHQASLRMAQKAKLSDINTWVGAKFLKKGKAMNEDSMEWFNEMANMYAKSKAGIINQEYSTPQEEKAEDPEKKDLTAPNQVKAKTVEEQIADLEEERDRKLAEVQVTSVPDIEAKKADIEKRRQEKYNTQYNARIAGQVLDNQGNPVYEEDKGIGANGLSTLTDKKYGHGHNRTSGLNSLKVLESLLDGSDFSGMFGQIGIGDYSTWESGKFIIVSNNINPTTNNKLNLNEIEVILNAGLSPFAQELANKYPNVIFKDFNSKKYNTELAALENNQTNQKEIDKINREYDAKIKALKGDDQKLIDEYKKRIKQLYKGKYDLARYLGDNVEELGKDKPSPQDIERYRELSKQPEETQELIDLRNKLQNWKLLDTAIDDNGMSIAEMIDIVNQQEQETEKEDTKIEITKEDVEDMMSNTSEDSEDNSFLQNQNGSVTAKLMPNGNIRFSHLKLSTIADRFGAEILDKEGKVVTQEDVDNAIISLKEGEEAVYTINGLTFTVDEKGRIAMRYTAFMSNQDAMNMYLINPNSTNWTYKNIYEFNGEDTVKLPSDFQEEISAKDILDLKEGDEVQFVINSKDGFNDNRLKGLSEEEKVRKLKIGIVKNGKFVGILKAGTEKTEQVLMSLRKQSFEEFKKGNKSKVVGKTKVDKVYLGSPAIKMNNKGESVNIPITQEAKSVIVATGFLEGGKATTNITIPENSLNTSFVREEQGKKSPFIIFKVGSQMVAYPVTMAQTKDSKLTELENALNKQTVQEQVLAVNNLIQELNIQTEKVFPETLESRLEELKKAFDEHTTFVSADQFASANYNTDNLTKDALINIDLETDVFEDPKVKISLDEGDMKVLVSTDFKNMSKTDIENELSDLAVELDRDYRVNADTKYLYAKGSKVGQIIEDTKYTNTFDDTPPVKPTSQLDKIRNMNILREALSERLPFEIKQIIGEEKLKEIDKMFKMYDNIIKKQLEVDKSQEENGNDKLCPQ